ncbi:winged helix-turn-helix transcriptional regulator [Thermodesulfobacteriota bacterium]
MDYKDIRTLKILEEIENDHVPSQRDLAKMLNVSLGLVNSFIKRLAQKGYFKITTIPKNRVRYVLTPKGAAEKTRLTYKYIHYSFQFYKDARKKLNELFNELTALGVQHIVFYGVSDFAEIAYLSLLETSIKLEAVVDSNKIGKKFLGGIVITDPADLKSFSFDRILITVIESSEDVMAKILERGISRHNVIIL